MIKLIKTRIFLFLLLSILLSSCNNDQDLTENNKVLGKKELYHFLKVNNELSGFKIERKFYKSGILHKIGYFPISNDYSKTFITILDTIGRIKRKARYGWTGINKNMLVENIKYDSLGNIDYSKSMFLRTRPNAINDTIYYSTQTSNKLTLHIKFFLKHSLSYRVILQFKNRQDTLFSKKNEWISYTFKHLEKGTLNLHFDIRVLTGVKNSKKAYLISESRRVLKISD